MNNLSLFVCLYVCGYVCDSRNKKIPFCPGTIYAWPARSLRVLDGSTVASGLADRRVDIGMGTRTRTSISHLVRISVRALRTLTIYDYRSGYRLQVRQVPRTRNARP